MRRLIRGPGLLELDVRQPLQPAGQVPAPTFEKAEHAQQDDRADHGRVEQEGDGDAEAHLLEHHQLPAREAGIGTHEAVLWSVLPIAVLLAAYAPRAISFAAESLTSLGRMADGKTRLERCGENLDRELHALQSWYVTLGYALVNDRPVPPPHIRDVEGGSRLLACVRDAARGRAARASMTRRAAAPQ